MNWSRHYQRKQKSSNDKFSRAVYFDQEMAVYFGSLRQKRLFIWICEADAIEETPPTAVGKEKIWFSEKRLFWQIFF